VLTHYSMQAHCRNCHNMWTVSIPKGTSVIKYESDILCPNCDLGDIEIKKEVGFR